MSGTAVDLLAGHWTLAGKGEGSRSGKQGSMPVSVIEKSFPESASERQLSLLFQG